MKATISGGLGFIGLRLARKLAERGDRVTILDNGHPQVHADLERTLRKARQFADVIVGDVRDRDRWQQALKGCDVVLHMAAETGTGQSMDEIVRYCETNVTATAILAEELGKETVRKVFLPSSRAIYGEGAYRCPVHGLVNGKRRAQEDMAAGHFDVHCPICDSPSSAVATPEVLHPTPASVYASTKLIQEQLLQQRCERLGIELRTARYQNVYGPGQSLSNPYTGVLAIFSAQIARGEKLNLFEDATISRDFVFIDDVVDLTLRLVDHPASIDGAVNIGTGVPSSLIGVVRAYEAVFGREVAFDITGDFRYGDVRHAWADISRLKGTLGTHNFVGLNEGIRLLAESLSGDLSPF